MASLANQTISSSYDGLIKTATDNAVGVSGVQLLEDGSGNSLALSVGRANNGVTITGNLAVDTNTLYVDAANNRVGIGTSSPDESLELYSNEASLLIANSSGNTNSTSSVKFSNGSTVEPKAAIFFEDTLSNNRGVLHLAVNSNTLGTPVSLSDAKLTINNSGNVGIGTSSPNRPLTIIANDDYQLRLATTDNAYSSAGIFLGEDVSDPNYYGTIKWEQSSVSMKISSKHGNSTGGMIFETGVSSVTERMRIDSSGNVGINESDPSGYWGQAHNLVLSDGNAGLTIKSDTTGNGRIVFTDTKSGTAGLSDGGMIHYDHAGDSMRLHANGSERMRIDSNGNLGVTTTAENSGGSWRNFQFGSLTLTGRLGATNPDGMVGTNFKFTTANAEQRISAHGTSRIFFNDDVITFQNAGADSAGSNITWSERMRITSGGVLAVGKSTSLGVENAGLYVAPNDFMSYTNTSTDTGDRCVIFNRQSAVGTVVDFRTGNSTKGSITISSSAVAYNTTSDYRLKENVVEMTGALDRVDALKPSRFNFIADPEKTVDGFLAHEVAEVVPEAISGEKDAVDEEGNPIYQGIDQSKIVPLLVGAIKELRAEIELLKSQLNA